MRKLLQRIFTRPVTWMAHRLSSSPKRKDVYESLDYLLEKLVTEKSGTPAQVPFDINTGKFIILSDQHKGARDRADDFRNTENNYMHALEHYYNNGFTFINLGDCEELWESTPADVIEKNRLMLLEEAKFHASGRYYRIYGNHDLEWSYLIQQNLYLKPIFGPKLKIHEGLLLTTESEGTQYRIFLTHGHQGDQRSDGNVFSKWFVAAIWTPIQRFLEISMDTISDSFELVDEHNIMMYEWSARHPGMLFISGHTHRPVFASLDHMDRLAHQLERAQAEGDSGLVEKINAEIERRKLEYAGKKIVKTMAQPSYFNTGCCCFSDGDLTGIEIADGFIRLVKWKAADGVEKRIVLEESPLYYLFGLLQSSAAAPDMDVILSSGKQTG